MNGRHGNLSAAFAAIVCAMTATAADASGHLVALELSGGRGWEMVCTFTRSEGESRELRRAGRGDVETIALRDVTGGSCNYSVPADARDGLKVVYRLDKDLPASCPFTVRYGQCVATFAPGAQGEFDLAI